MENEKQTNRNEIDDLTGGVFIRRRDGSIVRGRAIKNNLVDNGVAYMVNFTEGDKARRQFFGAGELEAEQADITKQLEAEAEARRVELESRLAGQSINAALIEQPEADTLRINGRPEDLSEPTQEKVNDSNDKLPSLARTIEFLNERLKLSLLPLPEGISHNILAASLSVWGEKFLEQAEDGTGPLSESDAKRLAAIGAAMKTVKPYPGDNFSALRREAQEIVDRIKV
jgi:hypothetical protein